MSIPSLEPTPDLAIARATLERYVPRDETQAAHRARLIEWIDRHPEDAHLRTCLAGHLTGSAVLIDHERTRVLLNHHRKLDRWLQFGGHCDGDANLRGVAWRETVEESGIEPAWMSPEPVDLDVHTIPERAGEPEHLHLDVRFVAVAPEGARASRSDESRELRWMEREEALGAGVDRSLAELIRLAFA